MTNRNDSATLAKPILILGAGGVFARHVAPAVVARGARVRGMVRNSAGEAVARASGVEEIVFGDLRDSAAMLEVLKDVSVVFYIPPKFLPDEAELGVKLVELAAEAGVEKIVMSGVMHPFITEMCNHCSKLPVHEAIIKSGMRYVILQPTNFMQSIGEFFWQNIVETGEYRVLVGDGEVADKPISWVDYRDVADVAAIALTEDSLDNGIFELCASGVLTRQDMAQMMSDALGRKIFIKNEPVLEWVDKNLPLDQDLRAGFIGIGTFYSRYGFPGGNDLVLRTILGRQPRNMADYLTELASESR